MTTIIVYHDTETLANRARIGKPGDTVGYRSIGDWCEKENEKFDEVINLSTPKVDDEGE